MEGLTIDGLEPACEGIEEAEVDGFANEGSNPACVGFEEPHTCAELPVACEEVSGFPATLEELGFSSNGSGLIKAEPEALEAEGIPGDFGFKGRKSEGLNPAAALLPMTLVIPFKNSSKRDMNHKGKRREDVIVKKRRKIWEKRRNLQKKFRIFEERKIPKKFVQIASPRELRLYTSASTFIC